MADRWGAIRIGKALIITEEQRKHWDKIDTKARKNRKYRETVEESLHRAISHAVADFIVKHIPITKEETEEGIVHSLDITVLPTKRYDNLTRRVKK